MSLVSGSITTYSRCNTASTNDLPNIPGMRRPPSTATLNARKKSDIALQLAKAPTPGSILEERSLDEGDEDNSLLSYFESGSKLLSMSRSASAFPSTAGSFNDISGRYSLKSQQQDRLTKSRSLPFCSLDSAPSFVVNLKERVCRFLAYFTEKVPENLDERVRSRKVEILFYPEDNTIEIIEPRESNSGLMQGKMLKRHQIAKPSQQHKWSRLATPDPSQIYTIEDFKAGSQFIIYNCTYNIVECDDNTRAFLSELGLDFGDNLSMPATYYDPVASRARKTRSYEVDTHDVASIQHHKMTGFHKYGRKVLRFYGIWDCRDDLFGDELQVRVHYMLADDTMEILPVNSRNSGRDKMSKLLKKGKVLMSDISPDGLSLSRQSTATLDNSTNSSLPASVAALVPTRHYHWTDLRVGDMIPVAGMSIQLVDADQFTREFYKAKKMALIPPIVKQPAVLPKVEPVIPAYTGFGSEADSLTSCKGSLIPSAPHKDGAKLKAFQGVVLSYVAVLEAPKPTDRSRSFVIQFYLEDDSIQILEPPQRNSGHKGGVFLARTVIEPHDGSTPVKADDLYLGANVRVMRHKFIVLDADERTLHYMEENCKQWKYSALPNVVAKVKASQEVVKRLILLMPGLGSKFVSCDDLGELFQRSGVDVVKQEVMTFFRVLDPRKTGTIKLTKVLKFILDQK